jgi:hypothetical protein
MKHKYIIQKNRAAEAFSIKEYAELDKGIFSFVCEENYDPKLFQGALKKGTKPFLTLLRTKNFFPPNQFAERIVRSLTAFLESPDQDSMELLCDDAEFLPRNSKVARASGEIEKDAEPLDDFIEQEDSLETDFDDTVNTRDGVVSIKVDTNTNDVPDLDENS